MVKKKEIKKAGEKRNKKSGRKKKEAACVFYLREGPGQGKIKLRLRLNGLWRRSSSCKRVRRCSAFGDMSTTRGCRSARLLLAVVAVGVAAVAFVSVGITMQVNGNHADCPANPMVLDVLRVEGGFLMVFGLAALQFPCAAVAREEGDPGELSTIQAARRHFATGRFSSRARVVVRFMIFFATIAAAYNVWATQTLFGSECAGCREPHRAGNGGERGTGCDQAAYRLACGVNVTVWVVLPAPLVAGLLFAIYSGLRGCWRRRKEAGAERARLRQAEALQALTVLRSANYQAPIPPVILRSFDGDRFEVTVQEPCADPCSELQRLRTTDLRQLAVEQHPELAKGCKYLPGSSGREPRLELPWRLVLPGRPGACAAGPVTLEQLLRAWKKCDGDPVVMWGAPNIDGSACSQLGACTAAPTPAEVAITNV